MHVWLDPFNAYHFYHPYICYFFINSTFSSILRRRFYLVAHIFWHFMEEEGQREAFKVKVFGCL